MEKSKKAKKTKKNALFPVDQVFPGGKNCIGPCDNGTASLFASTLWAQAPDEPLLIVAPDSTTVERLLNEIPRWLTSLELETPEIMLLPEGMGNTDKIASENDSPRSLALSRALSGQAGITLASAAALLSPAPPPETVRNGTIHLKTGELFPLHELAEKLVSLDYDDELEVTVPGEFARRGGLIDIFSFSADLPARVEFFGDEIDSIRLFDPGTQLSTQKVSEYNIVMRSGAAASKDSDADFMDYIDRGRTRILFIFPDLTARHLERYGTERMQFRFATIRADRTLRKIIMPDTAEAAAMETDEEIFTPLCFPVDALIRAGLPDGISEDSVELLRQWNTSFIARWIDNGVVVRISGRTAADLAHIRTHLEESGLPEDGKTLIVEERDLPCGLYLPQLKMAFLTDHELFGFAPKSAPRRTALPKEISANTGPDRSGSEDLSAFADLEEGDYAVHIQHGICIYRGLETVRTGGAVAEMIALEFSEEAKVYVPLWQAHCITRYIGSKKTGVTLNKLASKKWNKTRADAAKSVQNLAYGLLRMQAVRGTVHTNGYPPDGLEQRLFEEAFPFRETADQLRAADEIKKDMEQPKPMDRLLCGDVGFGKTELAMRAAFKAASAGRQVAVLVPTTVLAQQHYYSFMERFSGTPVAIDQLSRFRTRAEQNEILKKLQAGTLDIVIGTHRLVQEDVRFKDLGLIIIDEEQRFGVEHKDRLKRLRVTADVLTMTATPIPRTLYMSMSGMRDLSTIMSAPVQRLPIRTIVAQYEQTVIHSAVSRELERGGQVYFLHNRVQTIDEEAAKLRKMFPHARVGIGHGQMNEHELEDVMSRFIEGSLDILVCTTIIESGLDIPNANTIIIDRADRFGLAELYQLRGRVGRWTRQAYAYMLLPKSGILSGDARKRISAIRSYTHLGAGFKLAVRDLEIRGAGNILGAEQSGQINAIGFHLYCELLRSVVCQLKGENIDTPPTTDLFFDFLYFAADPPTGKGSACFAESYINSPGLRIDAYRRLAAITNEKRLDDFEKELRDRFGKLPQPALNLMDCARMRLLAQKLHIKSIAARDDRVYMELPDGTFLRVGGTLPHLKNTDSPEKKLQSIIAVLRKCMPQT